MDEHALAALRRRVDELEDLVRHPVLHVEENLVLLVHPVEGQVRDADALPHVPHGVARTVHDVSYLVRNDELQVLHKGAPNSDLDTVRADCASEEM